jgi:hypothetical protein
MRLINFSRNGLALLALTLFATLPSAADTRFQIRKMTRDDVPLGKGQCDIRLEVDDQVEVAVHRDTVSVRRLSGQEARDDGSECNLPLPDRDLRDFNFEVIERRGEIALAEPPSPRNDFTALVRIRDSAGGFGRYHFRLSWAITATSEFPRRDGDRPPDAPRRDGDRPPDAPRRDGDRPPEFPRGDGDRGPGGGFAWNNVIHFSGPGRGGSTLSGYGSQRLSDATVDIDRGGRIQISFRTDTGRPITFSGTVIGRDGDVLKTDVAADDRMLRLRGPMYITLRGREDILRITLDATNGRDSLRVSWDRR